LRRRSGGDGVQLGSGFSIRAGQAEPLSSIEIQHHGRLADERIGALLTALLIPPLLARINSEETLLRSQFGGEYTGYCARTSRLIPGLY
jgi:protein-S-isoprenylcysteine O-methyltransferase Ste14